MKKRGERDIDSPSGFSSFQSAHRPDLFLEFYHFPLLESDEVFPFAEELGVLLRKVTRLLLVHHLQGIIDVVGNRDLTCSSLHSVEMISESSLEREGVEHLLDGRPYMHQRHSNSGNFVLHRSEEARGRGRSFRM